MINTNTKICIVGGGFGGLYTALYLSKSAEINNGSWQITLVEPNDHFMFSPLVYEILTGEMQHWEIAPSYPKLLSGTKIEWCQNRAVNVDFKRREIRLADASGLAYDCLVLAVGTGVSYADIPGIDYAVGFKSLADAAKLEQKLQILTASGRQNLRIAVVGGGASGVELACKLADRLKHRSSVRLIERGGEILKGLNSSIRKSALKALKSRKVKIDYQTEVRSIAPESLTLSERERTKTVPIDLVVWAAGTSIPHWIEHLKCVQTSAGKLVTRPTLQLRDYPEVFALGDIAAIDHVQSNNVPATAQAAYQQASTAAKNIRAWLRKQQLKSFRYLHLGDMLTLGKGDAVISSFGITIDGKIAAWFRRLIYIQRMPTWRHRLQVLKQLLFGWMK